MAVPESTLESTSELTLELRIRQLEDIEEIRNLTARFAYATNRGFDGQTLDVEMMPEIYASDARWEGSHYPTTEGLEAIMASFPEATSAVDVVMHSFMNPIITVTGDTATGTWQLWLASVWQGEFGAVYMNAEMTYTRTAEGWRIQTVREGEAKRGRFA
jgi:hypothetical protein